MKLDQVKQMALDLYSQADMDLSDSLTYKEGFDLLEKLNVNMSKKELEKKFDQFDQNKDKLIQQDEFIKLARELLKKEELKDVFKKYVPDFVDLNKSFMTKKDFYKFLQNEQKQTKVDEDLEAFIIKFFAQKSGKITYDDFTNLIVNDFNSIYDPTKLKIYQSMDQPLTDYFINSSHNTYLETNQLTGQSSAEAYINAFRKGCRCIEIDAWDGKNEPIVTHGFTLTSSIKFLDVVEIIQKYGFVWSKYPIIMSIENHCNKENQLLMATILHSILGPQLYLIPDDHASLPFYPSPRQLKRKIIVKAKGSLNTIFKDVMPTLEDKIQQENKNIQEQNKKNSIEQNKHVGQKTSIDQEISDFRQHGPSLGLNSQSTEQKVEQSQNKKVSLVHSHTEGSKKSSKDIKDLLEEIDDAHHHHLQVEQQPALLSNMLKSYKSQSNEHQDHDDCEDEVIVDTKTNEKKVIIKDFQRCLSLLGVGFNIETMKNQSLSIFDIISLSEKKIEKLVTEHESVIINYHKRFFSRIYPKGSRVDSSNYDPLPAFCSGAQIIALNFQKCDTPLFMYLSKFQQNGGIYCGYILKPNFLCHNHLSNNIKDHSQCISHQLDFNPQLISQLTSPIKELRITIISGQCFKMKVAEAKQYNPFVEVSIKGTKFDETNNKVHRTKVVQNNTFHPIYNSQPMVFKISCPQLTMISFQVINKGIIKEGLIAQYALDFENARQGYRVIPLWDKHLQQIEHGLLLAYIEIIDHKIV